MNVQKQTKGFTIIEVVLVLAIAALIFLMIFIALPALQRGQRDTARKQDLGTVAAAVNDYTANHRGNVPPAAGQVVSSEDTSLSVTAVNLGIKNLSQLDPLKMSTVVGTTTSPTDKDAVKIATGAVCADDNSATTTGASRRQSAVLILLESGSKFCQDV